MDVEVSYDSQTKMPQSNVYQYPIQFFKVHGKRAIISLVIITVYIGVLVYLGKSGGSEEGGAKPRILEIGMWTLFIFIILGNLWIMKKPPPPLKTIFKPGFHKNIANVDVLIGKKAPPPMPKPNSLFDKLK